MVDVDARSIAIPGGDGTIQSGRFPRGDRGRSIPVRRFSGRPSADDGSCLRQASSAGGVGGRRLGGAERRRTWFRSGPIFDTVVPSVGPACPSARATLPARPIDAFRTRPRETARVRSLPCCSLPEPGRLRPVWRSTWSVRGGPYTRPRTSGGIHPVRMLRDARPMTDAPGGHAAAGRGETKAGAMRGRLFTEVGGTNRDVQIRTHPRGAGFAAG
jgi:hypothetical protein